MRRVAEELREAEKDNFFSDFHNRFFSSAALRLFSATLRVVVFIFSPRSSKFECR